MEKFLADQHLVELVVDALRWSRAVGRAAAASTSLYRAVHLTSDGPAPGRPLVHTVDRETRWSQRVLRCHGADGRCTRHEDEVDKGAVVSMMRRVETSAVPGTICVDATNSERVSFHHLLRSVVGLTALDVTCYTTESAGLLADTVAQLPALRSLRVLLGPALPDLAPSGQLTTLRLETHPPQTIGPPPAIGPGIVASAPRLRVLSLRGTVVGPDALRLMCAARNVLALDISDTRMSSDDVVLVLGSMPRLQRLNMRGLPHDEGVRRALEALPRLGHVAWDGGSVRLAVPARRFDAALRAALRESVAPLPPPPSVAPPPDWPVAPEQSSPRAMPARPIDRPVEIPVQPIVPQSDGPRMTPVELCLAIERARPPPPGKPVDTAFDAAPPDVLEPPSSILQKIKARSASIRRPGGPPPAGWTDTKPADEVVTTQPLVDRYQASRSAVDQANREKWLA
jgi:hypothetical protein